MHPRIKQTFRRVIRESGLRPARVLEVGGLTGRGSLIRCPELSKAELVCLNVDEQVSQDRVTFVRGDGNDMDMFESGSFDVVASNAMLEHDRRFWLSVGEMRRVIRPGGLLFIGVPGFVVGRFDDGTATRTYRFHTKRDYWRFSEMAVREEFLGGFDDVRIEAILNPPRILGYGRRPAG